MANHVVIHYGTSANGQIQAETFFLDGSGFIETTEGMDVVARRDITINGVIRGKDQSGASIRLTSTHGNIVVQGAIVGGSGKDYHDRAPLPNPHGKTGGNGGDVELSAPRDSVIVQGEIRAGNGGRGQDAVDVDSEASEREAFSGGGGAGGSITVTGFRIAILQGGLKAGHGGNSGRAETGFATAEDRLQAMLAAIPPGSEPYLLTPTDETPRKPRKALADSGKGGPGGSVMLKLTGVGLIVQSDVTAGNGGGTAEATATWAEEATARANEGGKGGDVDIDGVVDVLRPLPTPGNGGDCGKTPDTPRATAGARRRAEATVGLGGVAGVYRKNTMVQVKATGGNAGAARAATTEGCFRDELGSNAQGAQPGTGGHATCPPP
jgi:hypothetical protein